MIFHTILSYERLWHPSCVYFTAQKCTAIFKNIKSEIFFKKLKIFSKGFSTILHHITYTEQWTRVQWIYFWKIAENCEKRTFPFLALFFLTAYNVQCALISRICTKLQWILEMFLLKPTAWDYELDIKEDRCEE